MATVTKTLHEILNMDSSILKDARFLPVGTIKGEHDFSPFDDEICHYHDSEYSATDAWLGTILYMVTWTTGETSMFMPFTKHAAICGDIVSQGKAF